MGLCTGEKLYEVLLIDPVQTHPPNIPAFSVQKNPPDAHKLQKNQCAH